MKKYIAISLISILLFFANSTKAQWTRQVSGTQNCINAIAFADKNNGIAVGNTGTILKTADGGATWTIQNQNTTVDFNSIYCLKSNRYLILGSDGVILKSDSAALNWSSVYANKSADKKRKNNIAPTKNQSIQSINEICFANDSTGFALGFGYDKAADAQDVLFLKTTNKGKKWKSEPLPTTFPLNAIFFINDTLGFVAGENGAILKTIDAGSNWQAQSSGINNSIRDIYFVDPTVGYAVGGNESPIILKTIDGGNTWSRQIANCRSYLTSVAFKTPNLGYAVGMRGIILGTTDGGANWIEEPAPIKPGLVDKLSMVKYIGNSKTFIVGEHGLILLNNN